MAKPPPITIGHGPGNYRPPNHYPNPPGQVDYATQALGQTSAPYQNSGLNQYHPPKTTPGPTIPDPYRTGTVTPSTSLYAPNNQPTPPQPITPNATGQFGLAAGANPFNVAQNQQASTITGKAQAPPAPKPAAKKPAPKKKKESALDKYLDKDSDYQNTLRDLTRALADFKARQNVEKTRAGTENSYAQRTMGLQKDQDLKDIMDDAAARGIVTSGVYGQRVGNYNTSYNEQLAELGRQYNSQLQDFASSLADFTRQQSLQKEAARTAAIRRRSAKLGKVS